MVYLGSYAKPSCVNIQLFVPLSLVLNELCAETLRGIGKWFVFWLDEWIMRIYIVFICDAVATSIVTVQCASSYTCCWISRFVHKHPTEIYSSTTSTPDPIPDKTSNSACFQDSFLYLPYHTRIYMQYLVHLCCLVYKYCPWHLWPRVDCLEPHLLYTL